MNGYRRNRACSCARCRCRGHLGPIVLVTLGVLFLVSEFYPRFTFWDTTWPIFLIVLGIALFWQRRAPTAGHMDVSQIGPGGPPPGGPNPGGGAQSPPDEQQVTHG
jgi:cell wall-active antibiotic response 4TMS protein YvqF